MAYCSVNLLSILNDKARQIILGNKVGVVHHDVYYSAMMKRFELVLTHDDGYSHLLSHHDPHELIKQLGCYINQHWRDYVN